ncbi:MAG TPA: hypothetical protein VH761_14845 [Ilumatobacteraceae bacterium]|jgi:putative membrane protein
MQRTRALAIGTVAGAITAVVFAGNASAAGDRDFGYGYRRHHWGAALLMFLVIAAAVALLIVVLWRGRNPPLAAGPAPAPPPSPTFNAQSILADRLARGEISPEDYRAAISVLRETSP